MRNFEDRYLIDGETNTYKVETFRFTLDGQMIDGGYSGDIFRGTSASDLLFGNGGDDRLFGGRDADYLVGGRGDDRLSGGTDDDRLEGWGDDDILSGGRGDDALFGGAGSDVLRAGVGDDYLCAGSANDVLYGGKGDDVFVFRPDPEAEKSQSTYMDWEIGSDLLRIDSDIMPDGFTKDMIEIASDGSLYIDALNGHRMHFDTLDSGDVSALYRSVEII
jgi:Ca2+-binding RTX toxin-like protein